MSLPHAEFGTRIGRIQEGDWSPGSLGGEIFSGRLVRLIEEVLHQDGRVAVRSGPYQENWEATVVGVGTAALNSFDTFIPEPGLAPPASS